MCEAFIKHFPADATDLNVGDLKITPEQGREPVGTPEGHPIDYMDGHTCRVIRLDRTNLLGVRVQLRIVGTNEEITAGFRDRFLSKDLIAKLEKAFWGDLPAQCIIQYIHTGARTTAMKLVGFDILSRRVGL